MRSFCLDGSGVVDRRESLMRGTEGLREGEGWTDEVGETETDKGEEENVSGVNQTGGKGIGAETGS